MQHRVKTISPAKAERILRQEEKKLREQRLSLCLLLGCVLLASAAVGTDYLWIKAMARQRRQQHERQFHSGKTNAPPQNPPQARGTAGPDATPGRTSLANAQLVVYLRYNRLGELHPDKYRQTP